MRTALPCILLLLLPCFSISQAALSADSTTLLIGDQVDVTLRVRLSQGGEWVNKDLSIPDSLEAIRVLLEQDVSQQAGELVKKWRVGIYDTGFVVIPPLPVVVQDAGVYDTIFSNSLPFEVTGVVDTTQALAPIKDIISEPRTFSDYLPYVLVVGGIVVLVLGGWLFSRWLKRRRQAPVPEPEIPIPPDEIAHEKLDALEADQLWQQGHIKEYHSRLNYIIREYLQNRFRIPALESVTGEILQMLSPLAFDPQLESDLRAMLEAEDLIKFAKAEPPVQVHAQYLALARALVTKTKPVKPDHLQENEEGHV